MRFYLSSDEFNRVILDVDIHAQYIDDVIADDWLEAREAISESPYQHVPGHGYFLKKEQISQ